VNLRPLGWVTSILWELDSVTHRNYSDHTRLRREKGLIARSWNSREKEALEQKLTFHVRLGITEVDGNVVGEA